MICFSIYRHKTYKSYLSVGLLLVFLLLLPRNVAGLENLPVNEILQHYTEGQSWQERFSLRIQDVHKIGVRTAWDRATSNPGKRDLDDVYTELEIHKDKNRIHWQHIRMKRSTTGKLTLDKTGENYFLTPYEGKDVCFCDIQPDYADCFLDDPMLVVRSQIGGEGGAGIFGWFRTTGFAPLKDLLSSDKAHISIEDVGRVTCYAISCKTDKATTKAWFAPDKGFALSRCIVEQDASQLGGETLKKDGIEYALSYKRQELMEVQFQEIDGYYIPMALKMGDSFSVKDGEMVSREGAYKVSDVTLNPDFSADEFTLKFLDGKSICIRDLRRGLQGYEWRQGKIVPLIDQSALNAVRPLTKINLSR